MKCKENKKGITLIALVITIVVLLILATISISMLGGENGIITQSITAKEQTEMSKEKEIVELSATAAKGENGWEEITEESLREELNRNAGTGKTEVTDIGDGFEVVFKDSDRYYIVEKGGNVGNAEEIIKDKNPGDITTGKDGEQLDGSEEKPYEIWCVEDLVKFSQMTNEGNDFLGKYVELKNNLNLMSTFSYADYTNTTLFGDYNGDTNTENIREELIKEEGRGFIPIDTFKGVFIGNNLKISNIYINSTLSSQNTDNGLFTKNEGKICDITINGKIKLNISSTNNEKYFIGSIVGGNTGTIENVNSEVEISGIPKNKGGWVFIGGIAGRNEKLINNCINNGNINIGGDSDNRIAGIAGYMTENAVIKNSINNAYIRAESTDYACIGGIVEEAHGGIVENCANKGKLEAIGKTRVYLGGISGMPTGLTTNKCYNSGELIANGYAPRIGGIVGSPENNAVISNCYNKGKIKTTANCSVIRVGGIVGDTMRGDIVVKNSYNIGILEIQGAATAKGLIYGTFRGQMDNCYYLEQEGIEMGGTTATGITNSGPKTQEEMKTEEFVELLNKESQEFKFDNINTNNGYPILEWEKN